MFMKRKMKSDSGFTLAELLIVVAIIGVLVAIAIPIFTGQLEKSREAVDLSDVRSAYAEVMMAAITGDTSAYYTKDPSQYIYDTTHNVYTITVSPLKQQKDGWDTPLPITIGGVSSTDDVHWVGTPGANGQCKIVYTPAQGATGDFVTFYWEGGSSGDNGNGGTSGGDSGNTGGGSDSGNGGTNTGGDNGSEEPGNNTGGGSTTVTWPDFTIDNVIPFEITKDGVSVTQGNVYSYLGRYYVCIQNHTAAGNWSDYSSIIPNGNNWPYVELVSSPTIITEDMLENGNPKNVKKGTIYKRSNGTLYILKDDAPDVCNMPNQWGNNNWIKINR